MARHAHAFWRALLAWADTHAGFALFLHLDMVPTSGPVFAALREVCLVEDRPAAVVQRHAPLTSQGDDAAVSGSD